MLGRHRSLASSACTDSFTSHGRRCCGHRPSSGRQPSPSHRALKSLGEVGSGVLQLRRADDLQVDLEHAEPRRPGRSTTSEPAISRQRSGPILLDHACGRRPTGRCAAAGACRIDLAPARPLAVPLNRSEMNVATSGAGQFARREARPGRRLRGHPVHPERAPVVPVEVPADQVPPAAPGDQVVRLDPRAAAATRSVRRAAATRSRTAAPRAPAPPCRSRSAARCPPRSGRQPASGRRWSPAARRPAAAAGPASPGGPWRAPAARASSMPATRGRRGLQGDGDRDRLVVVEQQRRQVARRRRGGSRRPVPWSRAPGSRGRAAGRRRGGPCAG